MNTYAITEKQAGERLDAYLAKNFKEFSRSYFSALIKEGEVLVNKEIVKPSYMLKDQDIVEVTVREKIEALTPEGEDIPLKILYEDDNVIVIDKQPGLVVHPAAGNLTGTLVNALINHFPKIKESTFEENSVISTLRAGIVHRLDKDTSGVIISAKNSKTLHSLSKQIKDRAVDKTYLAICFGWPENEKGVLSNYLGRHPKNRKMVAEIGPEKGKEAISHYTVVKYLATKNQDKLSLIEFNIKTGRTHQIRVQSALMGHPVMGDSAYGNKISNILSTKLKIVRQLLHSNTLSITIPGEKTQRKFEADLPKDFLNVLNDLKEV